MSRPGRPLQYGGPRLPMRNAMSAGPDVGSHEESVGCPMLCDDDGKNCCSLRALGVEVSCQLSIAFVKMQSQFFVHESAPSDVIFTVPMLDNATALSLKVLSGDRIFETVVISSHDANQLKRADNSTVQDFEAKSSPASSKSKIPCNRFVPGLFRFPLAGIPSNSSVDVVFEYMQSMSFSDGTYSLSVPCAISADVLPAGWHASSVLSIYANIDAGTTLSKWNSNHSFTVLSQDTSRLTLQSSSSASIPQANLHLSYSVWSDQILASAFIDGDHFALFMSPPKAGSVNWPRNVVFLIDQSYSMTGKPLQAAKAALLSALSDLTFRDRFSIIAFDDKVYTFAGSLLTATDSNIAAAQQYVRDIRPNGCTDIFAPVERACQMLQDVDHGDGGLAVPFVVLLTDGADANERTICKFVKERASSNQLPIRFATLAIGPYANCYFLRMLAELGRGVTDHVLEPDDICQKALHLMRIISHPLLCNIVLDAPFLAGAEVCPFPIPDLYCGAPLLISGRLQPSMSSRLGFNLSGLLPDGLLYSRFLPFQSNLSVPLRRIFAKQRLESLTAVAWLTNDERLQQEIINESCLTGVPCAYTTLVAYEVNPNIPPVAREQQGHDAKRSTSSASAGTAALVGALAVGGIFIVASSRGHSFGNLAATVSNASVLQAMTTGALEGFASVGDVVASAGGTLLNGLPEAGSIMVDVARETYSLVAQPVSFFGEQLHNTDVSPDSLAKGTFCPGCEGSICNVCCNVPCQICGRWMDSACGALGEIDCGACALQTARVLGSCLKCFCTVFCDVLGGLAN